MILLTTLASVNEFRRATDDLTTIALGEVNDLLAFLGDAPPATVRNSLIQLLPEVVSPYLTASGDLAATWYEDLRAASVGGSYYATSSGAVNQARIDSLVRFGVKPLFGQGDSTVLSLIGGGVQRLIAGAGRTTIENNAMQDRVRVGFARIPRPGCCAFCSLLAGRGAVYSSESAAGGVVGRGVSAESTAGKRGGQGKGVKSRNKGSGARAIGSSDYHDFCRCVAAPVFTGDTFHKGVVAEHEAMYPGLGSGTTKSVLAEMRETHGIK